MKECDKETRNRWTYLSNKEIGRKQLLIKVTCDNCGRELDYGIRTLEDYTIVLTVSNCDRCYRLKTAMTEHEMGG